MKHLIIALVLTLTASFSMAACSGAGKMWTKNTDKKESGAYTLADKKKENYSNEGRSVPIPKVLARAKVEASK